MGIRFANETNDYRKARDKLLDEEIALRRHMESVAAQRRQLPLGPAVKEDYVFDGLGADGKPAKIKLSDCSAKAPIRCSSITTCSRVIRRISARAHRKERPRRCP